MARRPLNPKQLDLFAAPAAARPAPQSMEPRGSIDGLPPLGECTAEVARRFGAGLPLGVTGYRFQDGSSCCLACWPVWSAAQNDLGRGYRMSVYRSLLPGALARCAACSVPFPGETAQEELDRRRGPVASLPAWLAPPPVVPPKSSPR